MFSVGHGNGHARKKKQILDVEQLKLRLLFQNMKEILEEKQVRFLLAVPGWQGKPNKSPTFPLLYPCHHRPNQEFSKLSDFTLIIELLLVSF